MAYKISGTLNESARILVLKESDWSIEASVEKSAGSYEVDSLVNGIKTIISINNSGKVVGYGSVLPVHYRGDRGVFGGGYNGSHAVNTINYITISTIGNATDFGDLSKERYSLAATSNGDNERGVFGGGDDYHFDEVNIIDYITISTTGNAIDFGDLSNKNYRLAATSNGTNDRGVFASGMYSSTYYNTIDYITISSASNAMDFGDLSLQRCLLAATSNDVNDRGVFGGGFDSSYYNVIEYITISTTGNATDFGDLTTAQYLAAATSNGTNNRGIFGGGDTGSEYLNTIDYITISSLGNAHDFGDLQNATRELSSTSNGISDRGIFSGGRISTGLTSEMSYVTISTCSNATHFGNLNIATSLPAATSNA